MKRTFSLPEFYTPTIAAELERIGYRLQESKRLADAVLKLSDHYNNHPSAATPWSEPWAQAASLAYFFPLNYARNSAVAMEAARLGFFSGLKGLLDFGSGTGSALFAFLDRWAPGETPKAFAVDSSALALDLASRLDARDASFGVARETVHGAGSPRSLRHLSPPESLLSASYVLTELAKLPEWWLDFEALAVIEPSTRSDGRALMQTRERLIAHGFQVWAPCCHQGPCPLLKHSERDWCHDRVHWQAPAWFLSLENHLPMKNRTLTFSYLLARRTLAPPPALTALGRLTGDMLEEKGKTRQLVCRGDGREFLAWFPGRLPKGERIDLQRGSLVAFTGALTAKASELRLAGRDSVDELAADRPIK